MELSNNNCKTHVSNANSPSLKTVSIQNSSHKSLLTPCRRVGLKRKSASGSFHSPMKNIVENACNLRTEEFALTGNINRPKRPNMLIKSEREIEKSSKENEAEIFNSQSALKKNTPKVFTPVRIRSSCLRKHLQTKRLRLTRNCSEENSTGEENSGYENQNLAQLNSVLSKSYDNFLKHYDYFAMRSNDDDDDNDATFVSKRTKLMELKKTYDHIQKLKQSLTNAKQHNLENLQKLKEKWRRGCQNALTVLLEKLQQQGRNCDMPQLLLSFGIPHNLVNYDEDNQDFVT